MFRNSIRAQLPIGRKVLLTCVRWNRVQNHSPWSIPHQSSPKPPETYKSQSQCLASECLGEEQRYAQRFCDACGKPSGRPAELCHLKSRLVPANCSTLHTNGERRSTENRLHVKQGPRPYSIPLLLRYFLLLALSRPPPPPPPPPPPGPEPMPASLESLVAEVLERLHEFFDLGLLLAVRSGSKLWLERIRAADVAWRACFICRFGAVPKQLSSGAASDSAVDWVRAFRAALSEENETVMSWRQGGIQEESHYVFQHFVRSWASDDKGLVAGLYSGSLQQLDWTTRSVGELFEGSHRDEVICVALNSMHVLSGSGDPGYYSRPSHDLSVKLWCRASGRLLRSFEGHEDTVRGVVLFESDGRFGQCCLSAGLDAKVILWSTNPNVDPFIASCALGGQCRHLRAVPSQRVGAKSLPETEVRVLAGAFNEVVELAVRFESASDDAKPQVLILRSFTVDTSGTNREGLSGMDCFVRPEVWARLTCNAAYPESLLAEEGVTVAGGTVCGSMWVASAGRASIVAPAVTNIFPRDVVSVEILEGHQMVAVKRTGTLCLVSWDADFQLSQRWARQGLRMYVSTLRRREPRLLVSDGFDNAIRTLRVGIAPGGVGSRNSVQTRRRGERPGWMPFLESGMDEDDD